MNPASPPSTGTPAAAAAAAALRKRQSAALFDQIDNGTGQQQPDAHPSSSPNANVYSIPPSVLLGSDPDAFPNGHPSSSSSSSRPSVVTDDNESDNTTFDPNPIVQATPVPTTKLAHSDFDHPTTQLPSSPPHLSPFLSGAWFIDRHHRRLLLRGVNLSGNAKSPYEPLLPSHVADGFFRDLSVSFVGRPFPLADADYHFGLLRAWGFNAFRFCLTWEAVEHFGPGIYDEDYIDYVIAVLRRAGEVGLTGFLDPHQDVWSRHCGGDGAPNWTLRLAGLDATRFYESGAAMCHSTWVQHTGKQPAEYPKMIWQTNYFKLAAATMFTLFFGGDLFAPWLVFQDYVRVGVNEVLDQHPPTSTLPFFNAKDFLQAHFIRAMVHVHRRVHAAGLTSLPLSPSSQQLLPVVLGWDTLNEPSQGYIGCPDISRILPWQALFNGACPTPLQGMVAGTGHTVSQVATYTIAWCGPIRNGECVLNSSRTNTWMDTRVPPSTLHAQGLAAAKSTGTRIHVNTDPLAADCPPVTLTSAHLAFPAGGCIWAAHGVYDTLTGVPVRGDYFCKHPLRGFKLDPANFTNTLWIEFAQRFACHVRKVDPASIVFMDPPVNEEPPNLVAALERMGSAGGDIGPASPPPTAAGMPRSTLALDEKPALSTDRGMPAFVPLASTSASTLPATSSHSATAHILPTVDPAFARDLVYAPHWYDGLTLITKHLWPYNVDFLHILRGHKNWVTGLRLGQAQVRAGMAAQLALIRDEGHRFLGHVPVLLGEIGIPFDMDPVGQVLPSPQAEAAMDANLAAIERALVHATLWNYCPDNAREVGDGWNGEDLSVILNGQPRPMRTLLRPVPWIAAGQVVRIRFDHRQHEAEVCIRRTDRVCGACVRDPPGAWTEGVHGVGEDARVVSELYVPWLHFRGPEKTTVALSHGACVVDFRTQRMRWVHGYASGCQYCGASGTSLTSVEVTHRVQIKGRFDGGEDEFDWDPRDRLMRDGCSEKEHLLQSWQQPGGMPELVDKGFATRRGDGERGGCVGGMWEAVKDCFGCGSRQ